MCKENEIKYLQAEMEELKLANSKTTKDLEQAEMIIAKQKDKIKFMEGQIEAYRDCLNLKR